MLQVHEQRFGAVVEVDDDVVRIVRVGAVATALRRVHLHEADDPVGRRAHVRSLGQAEVPRLRVHPGVRRGLVAVGHVIDVVTRPRQVQRGLGGCECGREPTGDDDENGCTTHVW